MTWDAVIARAEASLGVEEPLRLDLPGGGRLLVDHLAAPFLVHRCPGDNPPDGPARCTDAHRLITSAPAYLLSGADTDRQPEVQRLTAAVADALRETGRALVVEVWMPLDADAHDGVDPFDRQPGFTLFLSPHAPAGLGDRLADALSEIEIAGQGADVSCVHVPSVAPPGLPPLLPGDEATVIGLAVDAVFVNTRDAEVYPRVLDALRDALADALAEISPAPTFGRRHLEPAAEATDRGLADLSRQFGFLLQVTPVNAAEAWDEFKLSDGECAPELLYRPLTFDPDAFRRDLFALPVREIEDPVVADLLRERRDELDVQIRMLLDRETPQFLPGSLRLFGAPDDALVALAHDVLGVLDALPPSPRADEKVGATAFAVAARNELEAYQADYPPVTTDVEIREDIPGSLMVSQGRLLVGSAMQMSAARVEALLAHEVGTHVLTYYNGCAQPLRVFRFGLAGYEDLQEGLAVLSEWLVGGLTPGRFRTLAARVLAAHALCDGADFPETVRLLRDRASLSMRRAFSVTLRIYRGGGLTKDIVYLRGLAELLDHLGTGGVYWPLFTGKLALRHLGAVQDLLARGVLVSPPLRPHYASDDGARQRLGRARRGLSVSDLLSSE